ncbi:ATP-binding protein [Amycolatopsis pittospori]|uniref:ATP-binding protein n=1 Tax=Amycolatopsis pittospori TaxID=2749434 RepID=UPI001F2A1942|nr:tetratricopeptide repeat protein [Amycolatopsis pittospori]
MHGGRGEGREMNADAYPPNPMVVPRQLPFPPPWLVGREDETAILTETLGPRADPASVVVLEGPGGVGKSTLALHWAHQHLDRFPDGQLYTDLGGFDRSSEPPSTLSVLHSFLGAFGVAPAALPTDEGSAAALYRSVLAGKRTLIVLDNAADLAQVAPLLPGTRSCAVLVTSRTNMAGLRLRGATSVRLEALSAQEARDLLAYQVGKDRVLAEPEAVEVLLAYSAGLPLAVSLIAARSASRPDLPLSVTADELRSSGGHLDTFDAGDGSADLRTVLSWSYRGLGLDEAGGFRLLGLLPLPEFDEAAVASLLASGTSRTTALLRSLDLKSLVRQHRPKRYRMHDLVHRYAGELAERVEPTAELVSAKRRTVDFYLHTALRADRLLYPHRARLDPPIPVSGVKPLEFAGEAAAMDWFAAEHRTLPAVQRLAAEEDLPERVWWFARALDTYQYRQGSIHDNVETSKLGVDAAEHLGSPVMRVLAQRQLGRACTRAGQLSDALTWLSLALASAAGPEEQAHTHHDLARAHARGGDRRNSLWHSEQALELYRRAGNQVGEAHALNTVARQYAELGDHERAHEYATTALALHENHANGSGVAVTFDNLGTIACGAGLPQKAEHWYRRALELSLRQGNRFFAAEVTEHLAKTQISMGRFDEATEHFQRTYELYVAQHRRSDAERVRCWLARLRS